MNELSYNPRKMTVLIVDDHELIRKSIGKVLRKLKFEEILECSNGTEAIKSFSCQVIDIVFLDIYMPKGDGFEVLSYIRSRETNSDIPVIVVTGESSKEDIVKVANLGAEDYLIKPFHAPELEKKIHQVLTKYHSPNPLLYHIRKSERLLMNDELEEADKYCQKALEISTESPRANYLAAIIMEKIGQSEKAISLLKQNIQQNPSFLKNYSTLADIFLKQNRIKEAIKSMQGELALNPKQPLRQVQLAKLMERAGEFGAAIEHYRLALLENPKLESALYGMGRSYANFENLDKAIYYFKRLRRHHPKNAKSLEAIVKYALAANSPRVAEVTLIDEKKSFPDRLDCYVVLAKFYSVVGRESEGLEVIAAALKKDPDLIEGLKTQGALFYKSKDYENASMSYKKAIKLEADVASYLKLAEILIAKKDFYGSMNVLHSCFKLREQLPQVLYWMAVASLKTKQYTKAHMLFEKVQKMGLKNPKIISYHAQTKKIVLSRRRLMQQHNAS